jgi:alkylhydroperoxidase family enzyme
LTQGLCLGNDTPMATPFTDYMNRLRDQLLGPLGKLPVEVRREIIEGRIVEGALNAFVVRVRANATSVKQEHIDELKAAGFDEDEIFDATVCAAFVAGVERYQAALNALKAANDAP